jgi:lipoprotein-releasing system permease protein
MIADPRPAGPFSGWERSVARRYLRPRRKEGWVALISVIAFLGIALAVAVLIGVMSIMNGFRAELLGRILGFNGHVYVAGPLLDTPQTRDPVIVKLRALPGVAQVTPMVEAQGLALGPNGAATGAIVRGVAPDDIRRITLIAGNIKQGSLATFGQGEFGGDCILVGDRLAASLGVQLGDPVSLISPNGEATPFGSSPRRKTYTVGGIFSVGMSEYDQAFIYMPLQQAQLFFGRDQSVDAIEMMLNNPDNLDQIEPSIVKAVGPYGMVSDWRAKNQSFFNALQVERNAMRLILFLIVLIAAVNIVSGLVMMVKNKGKDIGILRTIGASQGAIMRIFFMDGAAIGVLGTMTGLLIGVLFCTFIEQIQAFVEWVTRTSVFNADVYFLAHVPAKIDWSEVGVIAVVSLAISFVATLLPAWLGSRLDPVEALRYE